MKNSKALSLLLTANIISGFAQGISMLAIPWYFAAVLHKPSWFGYLYACTTFISLFWSLYAGTLIDRYSRKKIFILISLGGGVVLLSAALTGYLMGSVPLFMVMLVFLATVCSFNIHYPALYAFGQEVSRAEHYGKVNAYLEIQGQATSILSGALGALLLQGVHAGAGINMLGIEIKMPLELRGWKLHEIFLMDAITYFIAMVFISGISYVPQTHKIIEEGSVWKRIMSGVSFLKKNTSVFIFGNASYSIFVVLMVEVYLLLPMYVSGHLAAGADVYASAEIYYAIGALLSGMFIRKIFGGTNAVHSILLMMGATTVIFFVVSFTKMNALFFAFSFLIGITNAGTRILRVTWLFHRIPNGMIGRTGSVFSMLNIFMRFLFITLFSMPFFSAGSHVTWAYFICGNFVLLSALLLLKNYREMVST